MRLWEKSAPSLDCSCIQVRHWCASCQPALSPEHRALQQAGGILLGGDSKAPASRSAMAEKGTAALHTFLCVVLLQVWFAQQREDGVYCFSNKNSQAGDVCVHTVCARAGIAAPPLCLCWPQKWMCSCAATGEVCGSSVSSGKGKLFITLLTFHRKLRKILSSSNVLPTLHWKKVGPFLPLSPSTKSHQKTS